MYFLISLHLLLHFLFFNDFAFCAEIEGIHEEKLRDWANDVATKRVDTLLAEYNYLESEVRKHPAHSETREFDKRKNWPFNHYPIAACLDKTRVTLNVRPFSRYINANYVGGIGETKRFIATPCPVLAKNVPANPNGTGQPGPKENTIYDFWSMILQEKVDTIVMLCDAVEPPTTPWVCINYWHDGNKPSMEYATPHWPKLRKIRLNMIGDVSQISASLFKTKIDVSRKYEIKSKLRVDHIQWRGWPDHGSPTEDHAQDVESDTIKLLELLEKKKKIVVHCSAGIGRTGTILALHLALHKLKLDKELNVKEVVEELRSQRAYSVQKDVQYLHIYSVLLRFAMNKKYTNLNTEAIVKKIQEIAAKIKELSAPKPTGVQTGAGNSVKQESPKAGAITHLAAAGEGSSSICATSGHCG